MSSRRSGAGASSRFYLVVGALGGARLRGQRSAHSKVPLIGASGSIAGVVIAYLMLRPCAKITALVFGIPLRISAYWIIGVFIAIQFINLGSASKSDVAWWCHIGGMAAGAALFPFMRLPGVKLFECIRPGESCWNSRSRCRKPCPGRRATLTPGAARH